jgi:hypothetical protein
MSSRSYEDGPALHDPVIRAIYGAFALACLSIGPAILFTPLLRYGASPWWLLTALLVQPILGLLPKAL